MKKINCLHNTKVILMILVFFLFISILGEINLTGFVGDFSVFLLKFMLGKARYFLYIYFLLYIFLYKRVSKVNKNKRKIVFIILIIISFIVPYMFLENMLFKNNFFNYLILLIQNPSIMYEYSGFLGAIMYYPLFFLIGKMGIIFLISILFIIISTLMFNINFSHDIVIFFKKITRKKNNLNNDFVTSKEETKNITNNKDYKNPSKLDVIKQTNVISNDENILDIKEEQINIENINEDNKDKKYFIPPIELIYTKTKKPNFNYSSKEKDILEKTLNSFNINSKIEKIKVGPTITQYQLSLGKGIKVNKITSLSSELALALAAKDVRIQAPIPGETMIGIEVPNKERTIISLYEVIKPFISNLNEKLIIPLGKKINGDIFNIKLNEMPHLLVAGSTGSGKSVCLNTFIISILLRNNPEEVRFLMIDPKKVEFNIYNDLPHLISTVVTDPKKASISLKKIVILMEKRYNKFAQYNVKDIKSYNTYARKNKLNCLPYIIVIIDELADLMLVASKQVEESIIRISQMARAAGIHMILATQRPSVDVITGIIKSNIPSRIAFSVSSQVDSRTILDTSGAEKLIGNGDLIYISPSSNIPERIQAPYLTDLHLKKVVDFIKNQDYKLTEDLLDDTHLEEKYATQQDENKFEVDILYNDAKEFALTQEIVSISKIQRRFRIGFNRASKIMDELSSSGILSLESTSRGKKVISKNTKNE